MWTIVPNSFSVAVSFLRSGPDKCFSFLGRFTYSSGVLYFHRHSQSELHITWNLWARALSNFTFEHLAYHSMNYCRMQPIKAAWEPAAALPCHWEWTVGLALIGRVPESHLHLGQAALALNPHAPPFLPLGSLSARLPVLLKHAAVTAPFTPTDVCRREQEHSQPHSNTVLARREHSNDSKLFTYWKYNTFF